MATMTKARAPELIAVDAEPAVVAAAKAVQHAQAADRALLDEQQALRLATNPNNGGSADHRTPLAAPELIAAQDRLRIIETELRQLRGTRPAAEQQLATARRAAQDALVPRCREHLAPLVDQLWAALEQATEAQAEIDREVARVNKLLGAERFQWVGWPGLRDQVDARRRSP
jgi:hypothetical protein